MSSIPLWIVVTVVLLILFIILLIKGLLSKSRRTLVFAVIVLALTIAGGGYSAYLIGSKAWSYMEVQLKPRSGNEIYKAIFANSPHDCVKVINHKDQALGFDCCIWLQFKTCPAELKRILAQEKYAMMKVNRQSVSFHTPNMPEQPRWWTPEVLGDSVLVFKVSSATEQRQQFVFSSTDSSMVYYCDMTY